VIAIDGYGLRTSSPMCQMLLFIPKSKWIRNEAVTKQCDAVVDRDAIIDDDYIRDSGFE
jgi:hypothetical protein